MLISITSARQAAAVVKKGSLPKCRVKPYPPVLGRREILAGLSQIIVERYQTDQ